MEPIKLRKQIDDSAVVRVLLEVNKIRKISQKQMADIFNIEPNRVALIAQKVNDFLEKISYLITMAKLQVTCEDEKYAKKHPDERKAMEGYFAKDDMQSDGFGKDIVDLGCMYDAIGKFCISTDKFLKEITGTPGDTKDEVIRNILKNLDEELAEHEQDKLPTARYGHRFFKKLLETQKGLLPKGVSPEEVMMYIKGHLYDDDLNR